MRCLFSLPACTRDTTGYRRRTKRLVRHVSFQGFCLFNYARINILNMNGLQNVTGHKQPSGCAASLTSADSTYRHTCVFSMRKRRRRKNTVCSCARARARACRRKRDGSSPVCQDPRVAARFAPSLSSYQFPETFTRTHENLTRTYTPRTPPRVPDSPFSRIP